VRRQCGYVNFTIQINPDKNRTEKKYMCNRAIFNYLYFHIKILQKSEEILYNEKSSPELSYAFPNLRHA